MKRTIKLTGLDQRNYAYDSIEKAMAEGKVHRVTIEPWTKNRKLSQNRLQHHWFNEIHNQRYDIEDYPVDTLAELRAYNKLVYGVPYLSESDDFNKSWTKATRHLNFSELKEFIEVTDFPVTRLMTVKQMANYLSDIQNVWAKKGAILTTSDDLYYEAMGV